jgi:2,3-bisphosphoglycerate-independent phosphoglycerate mutase
MAAMSTRRKHLLLVPDGAADRPVAELNGRTPLEFARTPHLDRLAREGMVGMVHTIPEGVPPGSTAAMLSIMGHDPAKHYTGRAPLEAASMEVPLDAGDVAFRCNLVTSDGEVMIDHSAGEISTEEARALIATVQERLGDRRLQFYPGVGYRHLMVWRGGSDQQRLTPPHDILGEPIKPHLPEGEGAEMLTRLIYDSLEILDDHEINRRRRDEGKHPGNMIWFWDQGRALSLPSFAVTRGMPGAVVAAVDLVRGIAKASGLYAPAIPGATGDLATDFAAKGRAARDLLKDYDFVLVHVEAPDEAGHLGDPEKKVWAIEQVDEQVLGPILEFLDERGDYAVLALPDHQTPIGVRTHVPDPVPFALYRPGMKPSGAESFGEGPIAERGRVVEAGHTLLDMLFSA